MRLFSKQQGRQRTDEGGYIDVIDRGVVFNA